MVVFLKERQYKTKQPQNQNPERLAKRIVFIFPYLSTQLIYSLSAAKSLTVKPVGSSSLGYTGDPFPQNLNKPW